MSNWQTPQQPAVAQPTPTQFGHNQPNFGATVQPAQLAGGALVPLSGDHEILAAERTAAEQRRKTGLTIYTSVVVGIFALISLPMFFFSVVAGLVVLLTVLLTAGLTIGLVMAIAKSRELSTGLASPGALSYGQTRTTAPAEHVWAGLRQAAQVNGLTWQQVSPTTALLENSMSWSSWGNRYTVDLRPSMDQPGAGVVTVLAVPKVPFTYHDYGKNQNVVTSLLLAVPGRPLPTSGPQDRFHSQ